MMTLLQKQRNAATEHDLPEIPIAERLVLWYNTIDIEVSSQQSVGIAGKEDALAGVFFHARNGRLALGAPKC